jgi:hypothetical protein
VVNSVRKDLADNQDTYLWLRLRLLRRSSQLYQAGRHQDHRVVEVSPAFAQGFASHIYAKGELASAGIAVNRRHPSPPGTVITFDEYDVVAADDLEGAEHRFPGAPLPETPHLVETDFAHA